MPVDLNLKCFNSMEGVNGSQCFLIEGNSRPLEFDGRKMHAGMQNPAQDDCGTSPTFGINYSCQFNPELDYPQNSRRLSNKKLRSIRRKLNKFSKSPGFPVSECERRLAGALADVIIKTLGLTTQLATHTE